MTMRCSIVLFDLGNVLVHIQTDSFWTELGVTAGEREQYEPAIHTSVMAAEHGTLNGDQFIDQLYAGFGGRFSRTEMKRAFGSIIRQPIAGMEEIVRRVAGRCHTALVSNTNVLHYDDSVRIVPALSLLHEHFVSFRIGAMKPDPRFYEYIIRHLPASSGAPLFIDDLAENVDGAIRAGMLGHRFVSPGELEVHLHQLGVL
jgi:HAD superfamily hydrolase (TIGR01509 family)